MSFYLGTTSLRRSEGVHPKMMAIPELALSYGIIDFMVLKDGGTRTMKFQKSLVAKGVSKTLKSYHLIQADSYGHAIDLAPLPIDWNNIQPFMLMATVMFRAAAELGEQIDWGGHYRSWKDYPHFNLRGSL